VMGPLTPRRSTVKPRSTVARDDRSMAIHPAIVLTCDGYRCSDRLALIGAKLSRRPRPRGIVWVGLFSGRC
jgi:hypothetical protein